MEHFKTLAVFIYPAEYAVLRLLLEQENIRHIFQNETMISVLPFHSNAIGGIQLKVHEEDIPSAEKIIEAWQNSTHLRIV
ncbi:MAG: DUF2007 domain-containing protein [Flavobacteriaceae bacterium]|nr:DUF2007 domain-containing protein [Flavobacteriaceae bacterium]